MSSSSANDSQRRRVRIGKYEIIQHVATGGMGAVYKAYDTELGREVALKVLAPEVAANPIYLERFRREARSAAKLRHENIVTIFEWGEATGTHFLAMEFIKGVDLYEFVERKGKIAPEAARKLLIQALRALNHAYQQGIVHRDIKPSNFLLTDKDGKTILKLTDMGLARHVKDAQKSRLTKIGTTVGTVDYMAPEQARDSNSADIRSDIYSLGCTLYHLLAGKPPFSEGSLTERIYKHIQATPEDIRGHNPAVSDQLVAILNRMLEKKPKNRFQTPEDALAALEALKKTKATRGNKNAAATTGELAAATKEIPAAADDAKTDEVAVKTMHAMAARPEVAAKDNPRVTGQRHSTETAVPQNPRNPGPSLRSSAARAGSDVRPRRLLAQEQATPAAEKKGYKTKPSRRFPVWWPIAAVGICLIVSAIVISTLIQSWNVLTTIDGTTEPGSQTSTPDLPPDVPDGVKTPKNPPGPIVTNPLPHSAPSKGPQAIFLPKEKPDPQQLRREFEGPHLQSAELPDDAAVLRVSRAGSADGSLSSLPEALAGAPQHQTTIIEIHDNGPIFSPALAALANRNVILRAGKGYRPLVAWDLSAVDDNGDAASFLRLTEGNLTLENLDVVVKWSQSDATKPAAVFEVTDGNLTMKGCTVSFAGKHASGTSVATVHSRNASARCLIADCYLRGPELTAVTVEGSECDVLLRDSIAVNSGVVPLVEVLGGDAGSTMRLVRSTLVAGKSLLHVQPSAGIQENVAVQFLCCDCVLAQSDPSAQSCLLQIEKSNGEKMRWRAVNSLYAGWKKLLKSPELSVSGTTLPSWRRLWNYTEGDKCIADCWPGSDLTNPAQLSALHFHTPGTAAEYASLSSPGLIGGNTERIPPGRNSWLALTYDIPDGPLLPLPAEKDFSTPPAKSTDLYRGEHLFLRNGDDLGELIEGRLATYKPAEKVVFFISGAGRFQTSPIRAKGIDLVLHVQPLPRQLVPLEFVPTVNGAEALFQVEDGDLSLSGIRLTFPNKEFPAAPKRAILVNGGNLALFHCYLKGPLTSNHFTYRSLIGFAGSGSENPDQIYSCRINESVLASSQNVFSLGGKGIRLRMKHSIVAATGDALLFEPGGVDKNANIDCLLENNTFALCRSFLHLKAKSSKAIVEPLTVRARFNLFMAPFASKINESYLLHCDAAALSSGVLLWQGHGNGYDHKHLRGYLDHAPGLTKLQQTHEDWRRIWGPYFTSQPYFHKFPDTRLPLQPIDLQRLGLPSYIRAGDGQVAPGADLKRLGIRKM